MINLIDPWLVLGFFFIGLAILFPSLLFLVSFLDKDEKKYVDKINTLDEENAVLKKQLLDLLSNNIKETKDDTYSGLVMYYVEDHLDGIVYKSTHYEDCVKFCETHFIKKSDKIIKTS